MNIVDMIPMANFVAPILVTTSAAATATATQKKQTSARSRNKSRKKSTASTQPTTLEITSAVSDNSAVVSGTENTNGPFSAFEQAFGSIDIDCFSYEGCLRNTTQQIENHPPTSKEVSINSALITTIIWVHCRFPRFNQLYIIIRTNFKPLTGIEGSSAITITASFFNASAAAISSSYISIH
jgi:hypothetical protein